MFVACPIIVLSQVAPAVVVPQVRLTEPKFGSKINSVYVTAESASKQNDALVVPEFSMRTLERSRTIPDEEDTRKREFGSDRLPTRVSQLLPTIRQLDVQG
jgi:hypothetical protein